MPPSGDEVDWTHAREAVRGNYALLQSIVRTYLEEYPRWLAEMRGAAAEQNSKPLQLAAHSIKSPLRFFGAKRAFELAVRLEDLGRAGRVQESPAILADLEIAISTLEPRLREFLQQDEPCPGS
jgi:HPt (histidine-containing phosphotransfer) domain-containing protein